MSKHTTDDLVNVTGIAERTGVPRTNVNAWTRGKQFPPALDTPGLGGVRVYSWAAVQKFLADRPHLNVGT